MHLYVYKDGVMFAKGSICHILENEKERALYDKTHQLKEASHFI